MRINYLPADKENLPEILLRVLVWAMGGQIQ